MEDFQNIDFIEEENNDVNNICGKIINIENTELLCSIDSKKFQSLLKILSMLEKKSNDNIDIVNSQIMYTIGDCVVLIDLRNILYYDNNFINLNIINPKKYIKLLKQLSKDVNIFLFNDINNKQFIITDGQIKILLPKSIKNNDNANFDIKSLNLDNYNNICSKDIDKDQKNKIKSISMDSDNKGIIELLIHENKLKGINIQETAVYIFPEYINDPNSSSLNEKNVDLILKLSNFLIIDSDKYKVDILNQTNKYIIVTSCNIDNYIDVKVIERASNITDEMNIFD